MSLLKKRNNLKYISDCEQLMHHLIKEVLQHNITTSYKISVVVCRYPTKTLSSCKKLPFCNFAVECNLLLKSCALLIQRVEISKLFTSDKSFWKSTKEHKDIMSRTLIAYCVLENRAVWETDMGAPVIQEWNPQPYQDQKSQRSSSRMSNQINNVLTAKSFLVSFECQMMPKPSNFVTNSERIT